MIITYPEGGWCSKGMGFEYWYNKEGYFHRLDGPAITEKKYCFLPDKHWYKNGKLHREDGPAVEYGDGHNFYYLDNKLYSKENYYRVVKILYLI